MAMCYNGFYYYNYLNRNGHDAIMVVVDKLTKRAYFIPTTTNVSAPEVA